MKTPKIALLALTMIAALALQACVGTTTGNFKLPVAVGYQVPDTDVLVTLRPDDSPRGYKLEVSGSYEGLEQIPTGWEFTSPKTGLVYRIHTTGPGAPFLEVIGTAEPGGGIVINPPPKAAEITPEK